MNWGNRYNIQKTAITDPNIIFHGLGQLGSGIVDIGKGVAHGIGHELSNMIHPLSGGGDAEAKAYSAYEKMMNTPMGWDTMNGPKLHADVVRHAYDWIPQAAAAGAGYAATALGLATGYNAVKKRINDRRAEKAGQNDPRLVSRKQHWDSMHPFARETSLDIDGPTANPHHPDHDLNDDYFGTYGMGTTHPVSRAYDKIPRRPIASAAGSAIEVLSAKIKSL